MNTDYKFKDITEKIIGSSFEVHKFLGNGFQEVIYQRALEIEFSKGMACGAWARRVESGKYKIKSVRMSFSFFMTVYFILMFFLLNIY